MISRGVTHLVHGIVTSKGEKRRLFYTHNGLCRLLCRNLFCLDPPNTLARRIAGLRFGNEFLAKKIILCAIDIHIDSVAKEVVVVNPQTMRRNQCSVCCFVERTRVTQRFREDALSGINARGDKANSYSSILLKNIILEVVIVAYYSDHANDQIGCAPSVVRNQSWHVFKKRFAVTPTRVPRVEFENAHTVGCDNGIAAACV